MNETKKEIRYGFHGSDLFEGWVEEDPEVYDHTESAREYADQVEARLKQAYPDADVEVVYDMGIGGVLPHPMKPAIDGMTDAVEVGFIEWVASQVYQAFSWLVKASDE